MISQIYFMISQYSTCNLCLIQYMEGYKECDSYIVCYTGKYYFHRKLNLLGVIPFPLIRDKYANPIEHLPPQYIHTYIYK